MNAALRSLWKNGDSIRRPKPGICESTSSSRAGARTALPITVFQQTLSLLALAISLSLAAGAEHDPAEVLKRVTDKVVTNGRRLPKYTCVETVTRDFFAPAAGTPPRACSVLVAQKQPPPDVALRPVMTDRLRLDVTMVVGGEIFSWVGARQFDTAGIEHLVRNGPIGTGAFGGFLDVVFRFDAPKITFEKYVLEDGRSLMEFSFEVLMANSHYQVKLRDSWVFTGYSGTIQVDPETGDVVRMTVQTGELPAPTGECQSITTLDFGLTQIGEARFIVPARARQRFVYRDGQEVENNTILANCRQYRSESTISFESAPQSVAARSGERLPESAVVPAGLRFTLELTAPIGADTAAAGDPFTAKLPAPLLGENHKVLARAGSVVEGRLLRVQISHILPAEVVMVLKPRTLELNGAQVPFAAVRDWTKVRVANRGKRGVRVALPLQGEEQAGVFQFKGDHVVVKKGMRSDWQTVDSGEVKKQP